MVHDLRNTHEAVSPLHPVVSDPFAILTQVPEGTTWSTALDLKVPPSVYHYAQNLRTPGVCLPLKGLVRS